MNSMNEYYAIGRGYYYKDGRLYTTAELRAPYKVKIPWYVPRSSKLAKPKQIGINFSPDRTLEIHNSVIEPADALETRYWKISYCSKTALYFLTFEDTRGGGAYSVGLFYNVRDKYAGLTRGNQVQKIPVDYNKNNFISAYCCWHQGSGHYFGLTSSEYSLVYKEHILNGTCKAFIFDMFALILRDDLSIDAIVILDGCSAKPGSKTKSAEFGSYDMGGRLVINRVLWTKNVYIIKFITVYG